MKNFAENDSERYLVPGLARGIAILRLFNAGRKVISAPEMAVELNIPRSTVFRLASTLCDLGLLKKVEHGQAFELGMGLLSLGFEYLASLDISELGRPVVDRLAEETGCSAHLVLRDGLEVVVVYKAKGPSNLTGALTIGSRLPAHATVLGRACLADSSLDELRGLFADREMPRYTAETPLTPEALHGLIEQDRERGYAISDAAFEAGISAVAAPVRDHSRRAVGAVNITLPGKIGDYADLDRLIAAVRDQAGHLSNLMAHSRSVPGEYRDVG